MRVEIATCILAFSLAMLLPDSILPVADPLTRDVSPRDAAGGRAVQPWSPSTARANAVRGASAERVDFDKQTGADRCRADARAQQSGADFERLQNVW